MNKFRQYMNNRYFSRIAFFIVFTAVLLYIAFTVINDLPRIAGTAFSVLGSIISALAPLWIGLILAYILNPLVEIIDRKFISHLFVRNKQGKDLDPVKLRKQNKRARFVSILLTYLLVIASIIALLYIFAAMIVGRFVVTSIPDMLEHFVNMALNYEHEFKSWISHLPEGVFSDYASEAVNKAMEWIAAHFSPSGIVNKISGLSSGVLDAVLGIVVSIYLVADKNFFIRIWNRFVSLLIPKHTERLNTTLHEVNGILSKFLRGILLDAICVAVLSSIGLSIMGLEFSVVIGVFAGIANVIPYFGPILGMIPAFLVGAFTNGIWTGVLAIVVLFIVQQIDSNLIYPRIVGSSTGLKPLFVLLAVSVGGYYGGILGMIIAVPIASILQLFAKKWARRREAKLTAKSASEAENYDEAEAQSPFASSSEFMYENFDDSAKETNNTKKVDDSR